MRVSTLIVICIVALFVDWYTLSGLRGAFQQKEYIQKQGFAKLYWTCSFLLILAMIACAYLKLGIGIRAGVLGAFFIQLLGKLCFLPFVFLDDIRRVLLKTTGKQSLPEVTAPVAPDEKNPDAIPRSEFLMRAGILLGSVPLATVGFSSISGAYDYQVKRRKLYLPNLPKAFDGMTIGQISDIHSGSFYNKKAVLGGVEMLLKEKPDVIFFTGDLVNDRAFEMKDYQDIFTKVKAPLGVFSCLGNHDYGDYTHDWKSDAEKEVNAKAIRDTHKRMGWDLLLNENRRLKVSGEEIGILGVENWSLMSHFPKRGRMDLAVKHTDDLPVKLLLSHDPTHWRAEVLPHYKQIDMVFAGHTHGMQMGVQTKAFQWSPIEYVYREWAGFYREGEQQIYVNVGYGFLGFPGRVGILPEITIFELKAGTDPSLGKKA